MTLHSTELIHQVFRNHQKIRDPFQSSCELIHVQLINRIKGLKLNPCTTVELRKSKSIVHLRNDRFRPAVTVSIAGQDFLIILHQHIVYRPGINGQAFDLGINLQGFLNPFFHMGKQRFNIPGQMSVFFCNAIWKTVNFLSADLSVFCPAYDMASA